MFNPFKRTNKYIHFLEKEVFKPEVYLLFEEVLRMVQVLLADAIKRAHGSGFKAKRRIEEMFAEPPSAHAGQFKNLYYLLYFNEIAQTVGPVKNYKLVLTDQHIKYATQFVEQNPRMMLKFKADLQSFLNLYKKTQLAALEPAEQKNRADLLRRLAASLGPLGFKAVAGADGYYQVEPEPARRKQLYDAWYGSGQAGFFAKFLSRFQGPETAYSQYLKKTRRSKAVRALADLVCNQYPFGNPTKIKTLITFSVIVLEEITPKIQKSIDEENRKRVRQSHFFNADLKKLSGHIEKRSGEYYDQLGVDLNSFITAIRRIEGGVNRPDEAELQAQKERWNQIKKALNDLSFDYTETPDAKVMKLTGSH
ncbi:MAG: hypothetical protein RRB13_15780 [bacterium]|nr:hypothetical protein [bacterium]